MRLRPATRNDLPVIISWIPNAIECRRWAGPAVAFPMAVASLMQEITFSRDNSYCLEEKVELIGFGQLMPKSDQRVHAARIIVAPQKRGRGYGRKLCQFLITQASELKYPRISLNVYRDNSTAIRLYRSLGFRERERPGQDGLTKDIIYMETEPNQKSVL
jgi:ribosomal protein S18 acetylase RimI-like enzyme